MRFVYHTNQHGRNFGIYTRILRSFRNDPNYHECFKDPHWDKGFNRFISKRSGIEMYVIHPSVDFVSLQETFGIT